jgi:thioesterase domain-containing protein
VNAAAFLSELRRRDIQVSAVGGQLRCTAKEGALTPELLEQLRRWKNDILKALASGQALAAQERAIVPLQAGGARTPVFAVPGHNGDVFCYRALAERLGGDQPFFGLQPPGVDGEDAPLGRVEDLAACFARQIRAFQPRGPYIIAGYCAGGTVAYELARQLGASVNLLALFGSPYPAYFRFPAQLLQRIAEHAARLGGLARDLAVRSPAECRRYLAERLRMRRERLRARAAAAADPVQVLRGRVERATLVAVRAYAPLRSAGRVALFLPSRQWDAARRWRSVAPQAEEYVGPDGCGSQDMLREPNAGAFAELFREAIWKTRRLGSSSSSASRLPG